MIQNHQHTINVIYMARGNAFGVGLFLSCSGAGARGDTGKGTTKQPISSRVTIVGNRYSVE